MRNTANEAILDNVVDEFGATVAEFMADILG